jgi:hypothetical protein
MKELTVDDFVKDKVLPEFQPVVAMLRGLMRECAPEADEAIRYGLPMYKVKGIVAWISPTKKDITFSFTQGAKFEDRYSLLRGVGKHSMFVKIKTTEHINREALHYYIKQALEFDAL